MKEPVKRLAFVIQNGDQWSDDFVECLQNEFGPVCYRGHWFPFDQTDYYKPEMGPMLFRSVLAFADLIDASAVVDDKIQAVVLEKKWSAELGHGRRFNIDVGYLDSDKVVLPSLKKGPFKIYGRDGVWLDLVMTYAKGIFSGSPWSFEDFKRNPYQRDLVRIREIYKRDLKSISN